MAITDEAIGKIKDMIVEGRLRPGDKLPREQELAARLGVSRNSLREAVRALAHVRVLTARQGDGTYVASLEPRELLESVGLLSDLVLDRGVLELIEVRRLLEPMATAMAALRLDDQTLARLRDCLERMDGAETIDELIVGDIEFHSVIVGAAGNDTLASLLHHLSGGTLRARIWRGVHEEGAIAQTKAAHWAIFRALEARNPEIARAAATMHLAEGELWLRHTLAPERATQPA